MAAKSSLTNMVVCLTGVCLVCAAILGGVFALTKAPIDAAAEAALKASISAVLPEGGEISEAQTAELDGVVYEYYASSVDGKPAAYAVKSTTSGFGGDLTLMVGVLPDGTVHNTSVLAHAETPGLGAKCTEEASAFRTQFQGFNGTLKVKKDGGDIDAITASTITSRAFTLAVANAVAVVAAVAEPAAAEEQTVEEETNNE